MFSITIAISIIEKLKTPHGTAGRMQSCWKSDAYSTDFS